MAFRINEFKSQMDWFGGPSRGSLFEVQITRPNNVKSRANSRDLIFFCKNAAIPGMTFTAANYEAVGQKNKMMPMNYKI